jgi:outer membrane lipoprotein carrier protein
VNQRKRIVFAGVALLVVAFPLAGASESAPQHTSDSAKTIANLLERHYRNVRTLRAIFLERYSDGPSDAHIESGTVFFRHPGQMRWEYDSPEQKLFLDDGKTIWFYVPYDHTVTKASVKESSDWRTPLALLTGKVELSRLCSRIDLIDQKGVPATHVVLRCLPKGEKKTPPAPEADSAQAEAGLPGEVDFTEVLLEVDKSSGELARIEVRQPGGIELEYRFGNWQEDLPLSDAMFHFQVPVGVAIVDAAPPSSEHQ